MIESILTDCAELLVSLLIFLCQNNHLDPLVKRNERLWWVTKWLLLFFLQLKEFYKQNRPKSVTSGGWEGWGGCWEWEILARMLWNVAKNQSNLQNVTESHKCHRNLGIFIFFPSLKIMSCSFHFHCGIRQKSSKKWWQMMNAETKTTIFLMRLCVDVSALETAAITT